VVRPSPLSDVGQFRPGGYAALTIVVNGRDSREYEQLMRKVIDAGDAPTT